MIFRFQAALPHPLPRSITRLSVPLPASALDEGDLLDQLNLADRADWTLLGLVSCSAIATLLLAAAISLVH